MGTLPVRFGQSESNRLLVDGDLSLLAGVNGESDGGGQTGELKGAPEKRRNRNRSMRGGIGRLRIDNPLRTALGREEGDARVMGAEPPEPCGAGEQAEGG